MLTWAHAHSLHRVRAVHRFHGLAPVRVYHFGGPALVFAIIVVVSWRFRVRGFVFTSWVMASVG